MSSVEPQRCWSYKLPFFFHYDTPVTQYCPIYLWKRQKSMCQQEDKGNVSDWFGKWQRQKPLANGEKGGVGLRSSVKVRTLSTWTLWYTWRDSAGDAQRSPIKMANSRCRIISRQSEQATKSTVLHTLLNIFTMKVSRPIQLLNKRECILRKEKFLYRKVVKFN